MEKKERERTCLIHLHITVWCIISSLYLSLSLSLSVMLYICVYGFFLSISYSLFNSTLVLHILSPIVFITMLVLCYCFFSFYSFRNSKLINLFSLLSHSWVFVCLFVRSLFEPSSNGFSFQLCLQDLVV